MSGAALNKAIETRRFDAAYYFHGDEEFTKERALRALLDAALDPSTRDFNLDQRRSTTLDAGSLGTLLGTPPSFAERRVLVVREAAGLKKDARAVLADYLQRPAPDIVLVLVSPAGETPEDALLKVSTAVEFATLDAAAATQWAVEHARRAHGVSLAADAAQLLVAACGPDLTSLAAELDKCASFTGGDIAVGAVEAVVGVRHGETLDDLLNAVAQRRAREALALVGPILTQPKSGLVPTINTLGVQLLGIGAAVALRQSGLAEGAVRGRLWDLLKETRPNTGGPWGESLSRWLTASARWTAADVQRGLQALLAADRAAKDSRVATDEQLLTSLVLELCGDVNRAAA